MVPSIFRRGLAAALLLAGAAALAPSPAKAWWARHGYYGPAVVVRPAPVYVPPPVHVGPPVAYYAPPPPRVWVPPHWTPWGAFVPGHWRH